MTRGAAVVTVSPEKMLKQVGELMLEHGISGVPVVGADGRVLGVVSEADIVRSETGGTGGQGMLARAQALAGEPAGVSMPRTAGDAITSPAVTIEHDGTVMQAAHMIAERGVNRLPIVDADGKLVGIITRADVVRSFARSDDEIADDVRGGVVEGTLGLDPEAVQVVVTDGEVLLSGEVDTATSARLIEFFASRVPGVVAVRSSLRWRDDEDSD